MEAKRQDIGMDIDENKKDTQNKTNTQDKADTSNKEDKPDGSEKEEVKVVTDRQMLEAVLTEVRGLGTRMDKFESRMDKFESQMDRMEERQKCFEEETRNNFADIKLHLENITDRNISILAENHLNLINKMDVSATWMNRIMINEVKMNALTDQVARLQAKSS